MSGLLSGSNCIISPLDEVGNVVSFISKSKKSLTISQRKVQTYNALVSKMKKSELVCNATNLVKKIRKLSVKIESLCKALDESIKPTDNFTGKGSEFFVYGMLTMDSFMIKFFQLSCLLLAPVLLLIQI